jgi:hypothetical protein
MAVSSTVSASALFSALNLHLAESLCLQLLEHLQKYLPKNYEHVHFGILRGDCASVYLTQPGQASVVLWVNLDQVRDWFGAKCVHDYELMQEIEEEFLEDVGAQLLRH